MFNLSTKEETDFCAFENEIPLPIVRNSEHLPKSFLCS